MEPLSHPQPALYFPVLMLKRERKKKSFPLLPSNRRDFPFDLDTNFCSSSLLACFCWILIWAYFFIGIIIIWRGGKMKQMKQNNSAWLRLQGHWFACVCLFTGAGRLPENQAWQVRDSPWFQACPRCQKTRLVGSRVISKECKTEGRQNPELFRD